MVVLLCRWGFENGQGCVFRDPRGYPIFYSDLQNGNVESYYNSGKQLCNDHMNRVSGTAPTCLCAHGLHADFMLGMRSWGFQYAYVTLCVQVPSGKRRLPAHHAPHGPTHVRTPQDTSGCVPMLAGSDNLHGV